MPVPFLFLVVVLIIFCFFVFFSRNNGNSINFRTVVFALFIILVLLSLGVFLEKSVFLLWKKSLIGVKIFA